VGQTLEIDLNDKRSILQRAFNAEKNNEKYYCNFGLNPAYQNYLHENGFKIVGTDSTCEVRIFELENYPFFIATLFVPQDNATAETRMC
jgi:CTP synthase (UTP-ammonia lyase)